MNWSAKTPLKLFTEKLEILCFYKKKTKKLYGHWMGFTCLKATKPLPGDSLLFTIPFTYQEFLVLN